MKKLFLTILLCTFSAFPWGKIGHETVAYIAEKNLSPSTLEKIKPFLAGETLEEISIWADIYKQSHRNTGPWHYIDLPVREHVVVGDISRYFSSKSRYQNDDIVSQINLDIKRLQDPSSSFREKQTALKYLVHFIGDLHMPLHVSDDNDAGGNDKKVRYFSPTSRSNRGHVTSLHSLWDNLIEVKATEDPQQLGNELNRKITPYQKRIWTSGSIEDWAMEGYTISKTEIYPGLPSGPASISLPRTYHSKMRPIVDMQLEKAGIRLAHLLEGIFGR